VDFLGAKGGQDCLLDGYGPVLSFGTRCFTFRKPNLTFFLRLGRTFSSVIVEMICFLSEFGRIGWLSRHGGVRTKGIVAWIGLETGPS
jgi:hypothetical protein